ncbi:hypothetical protein [Streptomyces griseus]|uniref:hypothetical protein n=1 Tax=Streptomyces griseus TaxID=1911 RepID=UPI0004C63310|nr:hypothetical protein [Streptomyces griseus]
MTGLDARFTEGEPDAPRERAGAEGRGTRPSVHDAVTRPADAYARLFEEAAEHVLKASGELNRRLA